MAKKKEGEVKITEEIVEETKVEETKKKGKFVVLDSNGKPVREVATEEEAKELAKVYGGRLK